MKPYLKLLLFVVGVLCIAAAGNIYYEVLPGLQIKHPITGATTATINGTNGTVTAGFFVGNGSGLTGLPSGGAIVGTLVTNGTSITAGNLLMAGSRLTNAVSAGAPIWTNFPPITDMEGGTAVGAYDLNGQTNGSVSYAINNTSYFSDYSVTLSLGYPAINVPSIVASNFNIFSIGAYNLSSASLVTNNDIYVMGNGMLDNSTLQTSYEIGGLGTYVWNELVSSNCGSMFGVGNNVGYQLHITNCSGIYLFGDNALAQSSVNQSGAIYVVGNGLQHATLTNSIGIVAIGNNVGNSIDGAYTNIVLIGDGATIGSTGQNQIITGPGMGLTVGGTVTITNSSSQVGLAVNGFSGQAANLATYNAGGTNGVSVNNIGNLMLPDGSQSAPPIGFQTHTNTGFFLQGGTEIRAVIGGAPKFALNAAEFWTAGGVGITLIGLADSLGWNNDLRLYREDINTLQLGADVASPVGKTLKACDGSGTDKNGGSLTLAGGQSTGNQAAGGVAITTGLTGEASGSTANAYSTRAWYHPKFVALTHATATEIQKFSLAANKILGGEMVVTIYATNSVPHAQCITSNLKFQAVAIGTTIYGTVDAVNGTQAADTGTLTITGYTLVDNTDNTFSIKAQVSSDLATPIERAKIVVTALNGNAAVTITDP